MLTIAKSYPAAATTTTATTTAPGATPISVENDPKCSTSAVIGKPTIHPPTSILSAFPPFIIQKILEYVDQFDLVRLLLTCSQFYGLAMEKLYRRITVVLDAEFPVKYRGDSHKYISANGMVYMDSSLIMKLHNLHKFVNTVRNNETIFQLVKYFVFDKSYEAQGSDTLKVTQSQILNMFRHSNNLSFLHISFVDFGEGVGQLTDFFLLRNVRQKMFKLLITEPSQLVTPIIPPNLTNLFLMLEDQDIQCMDLSTSPHDTFNSLFTLTCSTSRQMGLSILEKIKLSSPDMKLKLKGLTVFHRHNQYEGLDDNDDLHLFMSGHSSDDSSDDESVLNMGRKLDFGIIEQKVDLTYLTHLYLKVDCNEHRDNMCNCYETFFKQFEDFAQKNDGLPNLVNFEVESYPNMEWLRPHQQMENILTPLGSFIKTLVNLLRLTIDFTTPGFKMFDSSLGLSNYLLNKLNEHLMEAFFLSFFINNDKLPLLTKLKTLQLPDFFTSFVYYKPDFMESLLHTCKCWGCHLLLETLKNEFFDTRIDDTVDTTYYMSIGYILGKLQADREVCIPIKEQTFHYSKYPINKGQPHTLHTNFHSDSANCCCDLKNDPLGVGEMNIDNLITTYIVHQLDPIIDYLTIMFVNLDNLMIHGIYYERDWFLNQLVPIYDSHSYPKAFLDQVQDEMERGIHPEGPFGNFRGR
ncbi:hypothetical protein Cantr_07673 [Candida viswanathii]|uniref:F-box domain-containing protein n=1 Tax=Candida viswanathii TaxID=5486 RepID=A0A367Y060_9ASCO|nr:hypothetical protein Cantr_07673 [Candida viswanathii]